MSVSDAVINAHSLLKEPAQWPLKSAPQQFSLPLQRLTSHLLFSKKWFPRFFVLCNRHLYYSDGNNGHPDSQEGTLAFVRSSPKSDVRYCVSLAGAIAFVRASCVHLIFTCTILTAMVRLFSGVLQRAR